jgi:hypothetical protein
LDESEQRVQGYDRHNRYRISPFLKEAGNDRRTDEYPDDDA